MRWRVAMTGAGAACIVSACGGPAFTTATGDASGVSDANPDAIADASLSDDRSDDASPGDAPFVGDAIEEPPPHCGGEFVCAPAVPSGWSKPLELYASSAAAPACSTHFAVGTDATEGLSAPDATCTCECTSSTQCSVPALTFYSSGKPGVCLSPTACGTHAFVAGACETIDQRSACVNALVAMAAPAPVATGSCTPLATTTIPKTTWATRVRTCVSSLAPSRVDCAVGETCVGAPGAAFLPKVCVGHAGDVACPLTGYTVKQLSYSGADDTRGCSPCTCGAMTGASCAATINVFSTADGTCGAGPTIFAAPFTCDPAQQPADYQVTTKTSPGACAPAAVRPTGGATPATPTTYCCAP